MYGTDVREFNAVLEQCALIFGPKDLGNEIKTRYWEALKDVPLQQVKELAASHIKRGKFFPKPTELRPREERPASIRTAAMDGQFREGEQRAITELEEIQRQDLERWKNEAWLRQLDRVMATTPAGTPRHEQARKEAERLRPLVRGY